MLKEQVKKKKLTGACGRKLILLHYLCVHKIPSIKLNGYETLFLILPEPFPAGKAVIH